MTQAVSAGPAAPQPQRYTSGAAIASLVCGIVSPCTCGLTSLPGLVCGVAALVSIRRSGGRVSGTGLAVAGIILSCLGLLLTLVTVGVWLLGIREMGSIEQLVEVTLPPSAEQAAARSMIGLSVLGDAAMRYAADHDGRLPLAARYATDLQRYLDGGRLPEPPPGRSFAMNEALSGVLVPDLADAPRTVLFFEATDGAPLAAGRDFIRPLHGDDDVYVIAFADGHVEWVSPECLDDLIWRPGLAASLLRM